MALGMLAMLMMYSTGQAAVYERITIRKNEYRYPASRPLLLSVSSLLTLRRNHHHHQRVIQLADQAAQQRQLAATLVRPGAQEQGQHDRHHMRRNAVPLMEIRHGHLDGLLGRYIGVQMIADLRRQAVIHETRTAHEERLLHHRREHVGEHIQEHCRLNGDVMVPAGLLLARHADGIMRCGIIVFGGECL